MIILGVDPGLRQTGYGIIDCYENPPRILEAGCITTQHRHAIGPRIKTIFTEVSNLMSEYVPEICVLEKLYAHYKHPATAILMGHARGVICLAAENHQCSLVNLPSTRIKKAIISNGHASKEQIQRAVQQLLKLKLPPKPLDVSDALAIALSFHLMIKNNAIRDSFFKKDRMKVAL
jgi:crossover junction endodeoxyribonuclease RuvC